MLHSLSSTVAVIKRQAKLDTSTSIRNQLILLSFPTSNTSSDSEFYIENLKSLVKYGVGSYFNILDQKHQLEGFSLHAIGNTKLKIKNMLLDIQGLQQTIQPPDLLLDIPDPIQKWLQSKEGKELSQALEESADLIEDVHFLNLVQSLVHTWVKNIQSIIQLDHNPLDGTVRDEITFWNAKESALNTIKTQLASPNVSLILDLLKISKRSHTAVALISSLSVKDSLKVATVNNNFLKNLTINNVYSAETISNLQLAIGDVFENFKKIKIIRYPIEKAVVLLRLITKDFESRLIDILSKYNLFQVDANEFESILQQIETQLDFFDNNVRAVINLLRGMLRKQENIFIPIKIETPNFIKESMHEIKAIRNDHESFNISIMSLVDEFESAPDGQLPICQQLYNESQVAYSSLSTLPLNKIFEKEGTYFNSHKTTYYQQISFVERKLVNVIKSLLAVVSNEPSALFVIFRKFNFLLSKPQIRLMLQQYYTILLNSTEKELDYLETQFIYQSQIKDILSLRHLPTFSTKMVWIKQALNSIAKIFSHLELILSKQWSNYPEGKRFSARISLLLSEIDIDGLLDAWSTETNKRMNNSILKSRVFQETTLKNGDPQYLISMDYADLEIGQELKCLKLLGMKIPASIMTYSGKISSIYKYASLFDELLRQFYDLHQKVSLLKDLAILVSPTIRDIISNIQYLSSQTWLDVSKSEEPIDAHTCENSRLVGSINQFQTNVSSLSDDLYKILEMKEEYYSHLQKIEHCVFNSRILSENIANFQKLIEKLVDQKSPNKVGFIDFVNGKLEQILAKKCKLEMERFHSQWTLEEAQIFHDVRTHKIVVHDLSISLSPEIQASKQYFLEYLNSLILSVKTQKPLFAPTYDKETIDRKFKFDGYELQASYKRCFEIVQSKIGECESFVAKWKSLQFLWDNEDLKLKFTASQDLELWLQILTKFREMREVFDTPESSKAFGLIKVDYQQAQNRIYSKFDSCQRSLLESYGLVLKSQLQIEAQELRKVKVESESQIFDLSNPISTISVLSSLVTNKHYLNSKLAVFNSLEKGQSILRKYRYKFTSDWIFFSQISDDIEGLKALDLRNLEYLNSHSDIVQAVLKEEIQNIIKITLATKTKWQKQKPDQKSSVQNAIMILQNFENSFNVIEMSYQKLHKACIMVGLSIDIDLSREFEEIKHLQYIWSYIMKLYNALDSIKTVEWFSCSVNEVKSTLEDSLSLSRTLPVNIRSYPAFESAQMKIKEALKCIPIIRSLQNDVIKASHWIEIFEHIKLKKVPEVFCLGDVLDLDLSKNEKYIKSIITKAESEAVLEVTINGIEQSWATYKFEVYQMRPHIKLISGWSGLLSNIEDDINILESVKVSPYYSTFAHRVKNFESRLALLSQIINIWHEAQKQWVYLLGIFENKEQIGKLIPRDLSKFENISFEFNHLTSSVLSASVALDITDIPDILKNIQRLSDSLSKIRISLVGYLEKQREMFPRFYFMGNDDLLELLGNSTDSLVISKHIKKLFTGISLLNYDKTLMLIKSVISAEGEEVILKNPVSFNSAGLIDWLTSLDLSIKSTLSGLLIVLVEELNRLAYNLELAKVLELLSLYPSQIFILAFQIYWTKIIEKASSFGEFSSPIDELERLIKGLTNVVTSDVSSLSRVKIENLIIELMHKQDIINSLKEENSSSDSFVLFCEQRFYLGEDFTNKTRNVQIIHGNYVATYSYEYLGAIRKLAYTPLLTSTFALLSEALDQNLGGLLLGPAGTGKTESVKALGHSLGRPVFVFCCDETFDVESVSRIIMGISQVGGWGCFDEFNRLEENILSGISTKIEKIQNALSTSSRKVELLAKSFVINKNTGLFITNNPNYEGRSTLPDNITSKFLSFSLMVPDSETIAKVILATKGFTNASSLAVTLVQLFDNMKNCCSVQRHYDFGLRSLKSVIVHAGKMNRSMPSNNEYNSELQVLQRSCYDVILPRLLPDDEQIFSAEISKFNLPYKPSNDYEDFKTILSETAKLKGYTATKSWLLKCMQIYEIQKINHGLILVGSSCMGKTVSFSCFLEALSRYSTVQNECYRIDANVLNKHSIFGELDYATREWKDGIVTAILRQASNNNKINKRIWIIFDCNIDPNWVENLNSVLDDNRLLTLPNGERITLPENMRIVFETDSLKHATPATVSRCGIVSFNKPHFAICDIFREALVNFKKNKVRNDDDAYDKTLISHNLTTHDFRESFVNIMFDLVDSSSLEHLSKLSKAFTYVMHVSDFKIISSLVNFMKQTLKRLLDFIEIHPHIARNNFDAFFKKETVQILIWSFASELTYDDREAFAKELLEIPNFHHVVPVSDAKDLLHAHVCLPGGDLENYNSELQEVDIQPDRILGPGNVISTVDTCIYEKLIFSTLDQHKSLILCGPPGSGKTMLLLSCIRRSVGFELVGMNFSKETTVDSVLKALEQSCEYKKNVNNITLGPKIPGKWIILFCDELNLPKTDVYGTQQVIQFLRQLVTENGFWHPKTRVWVTIENIQFVGACNPISTSGRNSMTDRFTNFCTTIMVDYPSLESLGRIYGVYSKSILKTIPDLTKYSDSFSKSLIETYVRYQTHFKDSLRPHYLCSPRELTRWVKGVYIALKPLISCSLENLIRLWAYEALRLFSDRLVLINEKSWFFDTMVDIAKTHFPHTNLSKALSQPILFSDWLSYDYQSVDKKQLETFLRGRFNVFNEEESWVDIVLYEDLLDHILRIDRVLKHVQGHMILVGPSGSGKTTLTKFVSWMNGIHPVQLNVSKHFSLRDFDEILKGLLFRAAVRGEKICFIIDESTILDDSFLEKMNTLLANAEVPGLFDGEEYENLISSCLSASRNEGLVLDSSEEVYQWFVQRIASNFHVIFTMNDNDETNPFISSPALYNRCVLNWMGNWSKTSLETVSREVTKGIPLDNSEYKIEETKGTFTGLRKVVTSLLVLIHTHVGELSGHITPSHFLNFLKTFSSIYTQKESTLQEMNSHVNKGLTHLKEAFLKVKRLGVIMAEKEEKLRIEDDKARELLNKMITDQNESERKQDMSMKMQQLFADQEKEIIKRREVVMKELNEVQDLIEEAQKGVLDIKKQHLTELRSMHNPPETIKLVLESICIMLGYNVQNWRDVQHVIRQDDFIASIINFKGDEQLTSEILLYMENHYLSKNNFNYESANRASKACGPLFMWIKAQLKFSAIVVKFSPLKNELEKLEVKLVDTKAKLIAINSLVKDLQDEVEKYKIQYSETIRVKENIRIEMENVRQKLDRSVKLLSSLGSERQRWEANVLDYQQQKETMVGNIILVSAFTTYCGFLAPTFRTKLLDAWKLLLSEKQIPFSTEDGQFLTTYIFPADNVIEWQNYGLPNDEQFIDNTAILASPFDNRFSFIIDPSELLIPFLIRLTEPKQLVITSFLDPNFKKKLENCAKFGGTILLCDGEYFDPVINRLIAKDVRVMGAGRTVVKIGDRDVDLSPDFELYIHTRDSTLEVSPFISSRMNILNYSFTSETMINEALNLTLEVRDPEVEAKRLLLTKKNTECKEQLKKYEKELLELLNSSEDNILDDDKLLSKLETLKQETKVLETQMIESASMIHSYNTIRNEFRALGELYAKLTTVFDKLVAVNKNYVYPKDELKKILHGSLEFKLSSTVETIITEFSQRTYRETSSSILEKDKGILKRLLDHFVGVANYEDMSLSENVRKNQIILLRSTKGNDATIRIKEISLGENVELVKYAMGSSDDCDVASRMIMELKGSKTWLVIENIEMSSEFLELINETISILKSGDIAKEEKFKLILTSKIESNLSPLLLKSCKQIVIENEQGLKKNMIDQLLNDTSPLSLHKLNNIKPKELKKLYLVLVWFFSLLLSRLRFSKGGFTKRYEISQSDLRNAEKFIGKFIISKYEADEVEFEVSAEMLETVGKMISSLIFGGKFDDHGDLQALQRCGFALFRSGMLGSHFNILEFGGSDKLSAPEGYNTMDYVEWIKNLPEKEPMDWLGLPEDAETTQREIIERKSTEAFQRILEAI